MVIQSVAIQFMNEVDRFSAIRALNKNVCPRLKAGFGLIQSDVLEAGDVGLLIVFSFAEESGAQLEGDRLTKMIQHAVAEQGVSVPLDQFISREHAELV